MRAMIIFIIPFMMTLVGYEMGPNYMRPEQSGDEAWRLSPGTSESITNLPWCEVLHDAELQRLIRIALEENKDLKREIQNLSASRAEQ